jgi:hypothetical protein
MSIEPRNTSFIVPWGNGAYEKQATLVGGSATISDTSILSDDHFLAFHVSAPSTPGALFMGARTVGTSVKIRSTNTSDVSKIRVLRFRFKSQEVSS